MEQNRSNTPTEMPFGVGARVIDVEQLLEPYGSDERTLELARRLQPYGALSALVVSR